MGILDDLLGRTSADASKAAAADTYAKQQAAGSALRGYGDEYAGRFADLAKGYDPYVQGGNAALERLLAGLGLGGDPTQFTAAYRALPGYEAGIETGSRAITGNSAAKGMLNSGGTLKALSRFGSDYEDKRSGDYLSRLMGLTTQGQAATGQQIGTVGTGLQGQLGTRTTAYGGDMASAGTIGQGDIAAAQAKQTALQNLFSAGLNGVMTVAGMSGGGAGRASAYGSNPAMNGGATAGFDKFGRGWG